MSDYMFPLVFGILGIYLLYCGIQYYRDYRFFAATDTESINQLDTAGRVAIEGTIDDLDDHEVDPEIADDQGVLAAWRVTEFVNLGWRGGHWPQVAEGVDTVPFQLRDETGTVEIDLPQQSATYTGLVSQLAAIFRGISRTTANSVGPNSYFISFDSGLESRTGKSALTGLPVVARVADDEDPPQPVDAFHETHEVPAPSASIHEIYDVFSSGPETGDRRYHLQFLHSGDSVSIIGRAEHTEDPTRDQIPPGEARLRPLEDGRFVIATEPTESLTRTRRRSARAYLGLSGVCSLLAIGLLLL